MTTEFLQRSSPEKSLPETGVPANGADRRKSSRAPIQVPIEIVACNGEAQEYTGTTRDVSSGGGVCFDSPHPLKLGDKIGYIVTLSPVKPAVRIGCSGTVLRCRLHEGPAQVYVIAASMERYRFLPV